MFIIRLFILDMYFRSVFYLGYKTVHEATDATILPYRCTFPNKKEIQIAQIFVDSSARYIRQRCDVNAISFTYVRLKMVNLI